MIDLQFSWIERHASRVLVVRRSIRLSSVTRYSNFPATKKGKGVASNSTGKCQTPWFLALTITELKRWKIYPFCSKHQRTHSLWFSWSNPYQAGLRFLSQEKTGLRYLQQSAHPCTLLHTKAPHSHLHKIQWQEQQSSRSHIYFHEIQKHEKPP